MAWNTSQSGIYCETFLCYVILFSVIQIRMATSAIWKVYGKFQGNFPKRFPFKLPDSSTLPTSKSNLSKKCIFFEIEKINKIASKLAWNCMIWLLSQSSGICGTFRWVTTSGSQLQGLLLSRLSGCYVTDHEANKWPQKRPKIVPKMTQLIVVTPTQLPLTIKLWLNLS